MRYNWKFKDRGLWPKDENGTPRAMIDRQVKLRTDDLGREIYYKCTVDDVRDIREILIKEVKRQENEQNIQINQQIN